MNRIYSFKNYKLFVIFFFVLTFCSFPKTYDKIDRTIIKGLDYYYHFNWEQAENIFQDLIKKYPDDPRGYHFQSSIYLWYYLSNGDKQDLDEFLKYSNQTLEVAENILDSAENNVSALYLTGANYNYRAIAFSKAEKFLDAAWASKKSESYLSDALEINPEIYDAYLGLGLYNFAVAQIPPAFQWALSLAGIDGDKSKGVEFIKLASEKGYFSKIEAEYYLSQIQSEFLVDYKSATNNLKNLITKYPENLIFNYAYSVVEIKKRNLDEAEKILNKLVKKDHPKFKQVIAFSNFLLGDIYFRKNNFSEAKKFYLKFLNTTPDNDYTGIAAFRLGLSYEIKGERDLAERYYELSGYGNQDLEDDIFAKRKGKIFFDRKLKDEEISIIKAANMIENKKYQAAYDTLSVLIDSVKSDTLKTQINFYLSDASFYLNRYDESFKFAEQSLNLTPGEEKWLIPFANYYAARAQYNLGNIEETENYLELAEDNNDYDYQTKIENLIYTLQKKLN